MSELRAILVRETDLARLLRVVDREVWVPRSITKSIVKGNPDAKGERACVLDIADWFLETRAL